MGGLKERLKFRHISTQQALMRVSEPLLSNKSYFTEKVDWLICFGEKNNKQMISFFKPLYWRRSIFKAVVEYYVLSLQVLPLPLRSLPVRHQECIWVKADLWAWTALHALPAAVGSPACCQHGTAARVLQGNKCKSKFTPIKCTRCTLRNKDII